MKKDVFFLVIFLILIFPTVSAAEIQFSKGADSFSQGETILAKVSGNFIDQITSNNIFVYKNGYATRVPALTDVLKAGDDFYIYAILGNYAEENYTLSLENLKYMQGNQIFEDNIIKNFTITNETADFSINPGFDEVLNASSFLLNIQNLQASSISLSVSLPESITLQDFATSLTLKSGEIKSLSLLIENLESSLEFVNFSSTNNDYSFPVSISQSQVIPSNPNYDMDFEPSIVSASLATKSDTKRIIYLRNTGETNIENVTLNISELLVPYVTISPASISNINVNASKKITLEIISDTKEASLEGKIFANAENLTTGLTLILEFVKDYIPSENQTPGSSSSSEEGIIVTSCSDLEGIICQSGQQCSGETEYTNDGVCCLSTCEDIPKSSKGKWIGWGLIVIIILFVFWFFKKRYRGVKRDVDLLKIGKRRR